MKHAVTAAVLALVAGMATAQQGVPALNTLIDESIGYVNLGPGLILVEDNVSSHICRIRVADTYFDAYAAGDRDTMAQNAPSVVCVPTEDFIQ